MTIDWPIHFWSLSKSWPGFRCSFFCIYVCVFNFFLHFCIFFSTYFFNLCDCFEHNFILCSTAHGTINPFTYPYFPISFFIVFWFPPLFLFCADDVQANRSSHHLIAYGIGDRFNAKFPDLCNYSDLLTKTWTELMGQHFRQNCIKTGGGSFWGEYEPGVPQWSSHKIVCSVHVCLIS